MDIAVSKPLIAPEFEFSGNFKWNEELDVAVSGSVHELAANEITLDEPFITSLLKAGVLRQISSLRDLAKGWDSYAAEPPNEKAIRNAMDALNILARQSKFPTKVSPSADEGVIFEFLDGNHYSLLEFCNDGDIVFLKRRNGRTEAFDISSTEIEMRVREIKIG